MLTRNRKPKSTLRRRCRSEQQLNATEMEVPYAVEAN